jgi:hypothetical protein
VSIRKNCTSRMSRHLELCLRDLPLRAARHLTGGPGLNVEWVVEEIVGGASLASCGSLAINQRYALLITARRAGAVPINGDHDVFDRRAQRKELCWSVETI